MHFFLNFLAFFRAKTPLAKTKVGGGRAYAIFEYMFFRSQKTKYEESVFAKIFVCNQRLSQKLGARQKRAARAIVKTPFLEQLILLPPHKYPPTL